MPAREGRTPLIAAPTGKQSLSPFRLVTYSHIRREYTTFSTVWRRFPHPNLLGSGDEFFHHGFSRSVFTCFFQRVTWLTFAKGSNHIRGCFTRVLTNPARMGQIQKFAVVPAPQRAFTPKPVERIKYCVGSQPHSCAHVSPLGRYGRIGKPASSPEPVVYSAYPTRLLGQHHSRPTRTRPFMSTLPSGLTIRANSRSQGPDSHHRPSGVHCPRTSGNCSNDCRVWFLDICTYFAMVGRANKRVFETLYFGPTSNRRPNSREVVVIVGTLTSNRYGNGGGVPVAEAPDLDI